MRNWISLDPIANEIFQDLISNLDLQLGPRLNKGCTENPCSEVYKYLRKMVDWTDGFRPVHRVDLGEHNNKQSIGLFHVDLSCRLDIVSSPPMESTMPQNYGVSNRLNHTQQCKSACHHRKEIPNFEGYPPGPLIGCPGSYSSLPYMYSFPLSPSFLFVHSTVNSLLCLPSHLVAAFPRRSFH